MAVELFYSLLSISFTQGRKQKITMNTTCRISDSILIVFLIPLGCILFSGCAQKLVSIDELIVAPEPYLGKEVTISGEIYDIEREGGSVIGKSFTIQLTSPTRAELLKCEFERGKDSPPHYLRDGQLVRITGTVDIVQGETILRKCQVED